METGPVASALSSSALNRLNFSPSTRKMSLSLNSEAIRAFPQRALSTFRLPPSLLTKLSQKGFHVLEDIAHLRPVDLSRGNSA